MKRRLVSYVLPYLVSRYISGFLTEIKVPFDCLMTIPLEVVLPNGLIFVTCTDHLFDLSQSEPLYAGKVQKVLENYRMVRTSTIACENRVFDLRFDEQLDSQ